MQGTMQIIQGDVNQTALGPEAFILNNKGD